MADLLKAIRNNDPGLVKEILYGSSRNENILNLFAIYVAAVEEDDNQEIKGALQTFGGQFDHKYDFMQDSTLLPELDINRGMAYLVSDCQLDLLRELLEAGLSTDIVDIEGKSLVHHAAAVDSVDSIQLLREHNANVDAENLQHIRPLMEACRNGSTRAFQLLLECTDNVDHYDLFHQTALHFACKNGSMDCVQGLMDKNIKLRQSLQNETELMVALSHNSENVIKMLIDYGADVHFSNRMGYTALHYAAKYNCPAAAELLCQAQVAQGKMNRHGFTALAVAAKNGHIDVLNVLIQNLESKEILEIETKSHVRAIDLASMMGHCECVEALLLAGADMNIKRTIVYATQGGHKDVLQLLISTYKRHQNCNDWYLGGLEIVDNFGMSPLHIAAIYGHVDCVSLLLNEGANPCQAMISTAETPLMLACRNDYHEVVSALVNVISENPYKCGLNQMSSNLKTALHYAASLGAMKCAKILLKAGAIPDIRDAFGSTPLVLAVEKGHINLVKLLLEATPSLSCGSRPDRGSMYGNNPWIHCNGPAMLAAKHGKYDILKLILDHGANIACADSDGITLIHQAARFNNSDCMELLIERGANIEARSVLSQTPLNLALTQGSCTSVSCLIYNNAKLTNLDISSICSSIPLYVNILVLLWRVSCIAIDRYVKEYSLNSDQTLKQAQILHDIISNPASLMMLSRALIRANMPSGLQFRNALDELPIPTKLQEYIGLKREDCEITATFT